MPLGDWRLMSRRTVSSASGLCSRVVAPSSFGIMSRATPCGPSRSSTREHRLARGAAFERVGAGAGVGEDERRAPAPACGASPRRRRSRRSTARRARPAPPATSRMSAGDVIGVVVDGRVDALGPLVGRAAEAAQVGRQDAPAAEGALELRLPHLRAEREGMHQHQHGLVGRRRDRCRGRRACGNRAARYWRTTSRNLTARRRRRRVPGGRV